MKRFLLPIFILTLLGGIAEAKKKAEEQPFDHTHQKWTNILKHYQAPDGDIYYRQLQADTKKNKYHPFHKYLKELSSIKKRTYDKWNRNQKMAFLINAYNAFTVQLIIDSYPVKGIKKTVGFLKSPWSKKFFSILDGEIRTLDPIEHDILRPEFKDARIHAAVNCASISCPRLHKVAFIPEKLNEQLEEVFVDWISDETRNRYEPESGTLYLSMIFRWYGDDFDKVEGRYFQDGNFLKVIERLGPQKATQVFKNAQQTDKKPTVKYLSYDWNLNDASDEYKGRTVSTKKEATKKKEKKKK